MTGIWRWEVNGLILVLLGLAPAFSQVQPASAPSAREAFRKIQTLAGEWEITVTALAQVFADAPSASLELKQLRSGIAVVTILINGKDRRFVVDPGSETTSVSPEIVGITQEKLEALQQNSTVQTTGFTGHAKTVLARTSFVLGAMEFHNRIVVVQDFSAISDSLGEHVDGLLGQDMLTQFSSVTFDYKHGVLNLSK